MKCGREYASHRRRKEEAAQPELRFRAAMRPLLEARGPAGGDGPAARSASACPPRCTKRSSIPCGTPSSPAWGSGSWRSARRAGCWSRAAALVNSDFCAPMVAAHGYVRQLLEGGADFLFFPAVVNEDDPGLAGVELYRHKTGDDYFCYYSQYLPTIVSKLTTLDLMDRLISPLVHFHRRSDEEVARDLHAELARYFPGLGAEEVLASYATARRAYLDCRAAWRAEAGRLLRGQGPAPEGVRVALLGRPYVIFDRALNLELPRKLEELGAEVFWQEELEPPGGEPGSTASPGYAGKYLERMHWHYGKSILRAAEQAAVTPGLYPVFITCFRCSPDSFLMSYVKDILDHYGKPFLVLQLDEQASDVGYTTRIEAGLRTFPEPPARNGRARAGTRPAGAGRPGWGAGWAGAQRPPRGGRHRPGALSGPGHQPVLGGQLHRAAATTPCCWRPTSRRWPPATATPTAGSACPWCPSWAGRSRRCRAGAWTRQDLLLPAHFLPCLQLSPVPDPGGAGVPLRRLGRREDRPAERHVLGRRPAAGHRGQNASKPTSWPASCTSCATASSPTR